MQRLLIDALAAHRLTRLVTSDTLTEPVRARIIEAAYVAAGSAEQHRPEWPETWDDAVHADPRPPKLAELVTCRWCAGVWVALAIVVVGRRLPAWRWLSEALALSSAAALLAAVED